MSTPEAPDEARNWSADDDAPTRCPADTVSLPPIDFDALSRRAVAGTVPATNVAAAPAMAAQPRPAPAPAPTPAPAMPAAVAPVIPVAPVAPAPAAATAAAATTSAAPLTRLNDWAAAWEAKDVKRYLSFYAPGFVPAQGSVAAWRARREAMLSKQGAIRVKLDSVDFRTVGADTTQTRFRQSYESVGYGDVVVKEITWQQIDGQWFIVKESTL